MTTRRSGARPADPPETEAQRVAALMREPNTIFVFGSNLAGRHGRGAARTARAVYAAEPGIGTGPTGRCYAIPTKDRELRPLALGILELEAGIFLDYAYEHPEQRFILTRVGCGLAGYTDEQIAPFFRDAPWNVVLPPAWARLLSAPRDAALADSLGARVVRAALDAYVQGAASVTGRPEDEDDLWQLRDAWDALGARTAVQQLVRPEVYAAEYARFWDQQEAQLLSEEPPCDDDEDECLEPDDDDIPF